MNGFTLFEVLIVVALVTIVVGAVAAFSTPLLAREEMRSAAYAAQTLMQLSRMEAVARNRPCRFVVDVAANRFEVWDGNGTASRDDDTRLTVRALPSAVAFARPDTGAAVTLAAIGGTAFETVFASDGTAASGTGIVGLHAADAFDRVAVFDAGGVRLEHWTGTSWSAR